MKIGVITTSYPRWPGDAAGNFVEAHVRAMRALGHEVEVIAAGEPIRTEPIRTEPIRSGVTAKGELHKGREGLTPVRIASGLFFRGGAPDLLERGHGFIDALSFTARLTAAVVRRARHWDLAIAHWLAPSALAAIPTRVPVLAIAHGGDVHTLARLHLLKPAIAMLRVRGVRLSFVSSELRAIAHAPDGLVQPMGIDVDHFARLPRRPNGSILMLTRRVPIKGIDLAITAARDHRLVIAGGGPDRYAHGSNVTLLGEVDPARRDELLSTASLVIIPSRVLPNGRTEGTPLVALEALAAGVPVIASRTGGLADLPLIHVPPDDPVALAAAIDHALAAPPPPRVDMTRFAWPEVAQRLLTHALVRTRVTDFAL
ncbi:MAG: glycosyltransferase family 4 protein [Deltaproteobacteria bacterium]